MIQLEKTRILLNTQLILFDLKINVTDLFNLMTAKGFVPVSFQALLKLFLLDEEFRIHLL